MRHFAVERLEQEVTSFLRRWTGLLAQNDWQAATAWLDLHPAEHLQWDAEKLQRLFFTEAEFRGAFVITNPSEMDLENERIDFYYYDNQTGFAVDYDLPVDGEWSDLTAQFEFIKKGEEFAVYLLGVLVL